MRPILLALVVTLALPAVAGADASRFDAVEVPATDLADASGAVAPTAAGGHVVFSRLDPATNRYVLVEWTAQAGARVLPAGDRGVPFDADAALGAGGRPVVTWSRCATDATLAGPLPTLSFAGARGCRPVVLALDRPGARPRPLRLRGAAGRSLSTPSAHGRGLVAVAAGKPARLLFWRTPDTRPVRLHGGPAGGATSVDALDLGARSVTFLWRRAQPGLGTADGAQVRVASLRGGTGRAVRGTDGYVSGACGFRQPLSPAATPAGQASFLLVNSPCDTLQTTFTRTAARGVTGARTKDALAYGAAWDGARVFWLRGPAPAAGQRGGCAAGCRLVVSDAVPFATAPR